MSVEDQNIHPLAGVVVTCRWTTGVYFGPVVQSTASDGTGTCPVWDGESPGHLGASVHSETFTVNLPSNPTPGLVLSGYTWNSGADSPNPAVTIGESAVETICLCPFDTLNPLGSPGNTNEMANSQTASRVLIPVEVASQVSR